VALRFGVAGVAPILVQRGLARDRLGWLGLAVIIAGTGAPYALVAAVGLRFAPASDGGALNPGCMPFARERPSPWAIGSARIAGR
jgi:hypothetical protein